jgi:hypothetical protein
MGKKCTGMSKETMLARHDLNQKVVAAIRRASKAADFFLWELHDALWPNDYQLKDNERKSERMSTDLYRAKFLEEGLFERVDAVLRLCEGTDAYEPFLEEMETLGVVRRQARWGQPATLRIVHGNEPVDIVFIRHREARPKTDDEEHPSLRDVLTEPGIVRIVSQDEEPKTVDLSEGWRTAYADSNSPRRWSRR